MKNNNGLKIFNGLWMKSAFSLMEMMIVLLIISIIAAATAPMVSKKMAANVGSGDSPWVFSNTAGSISYNLNGGNVSAIVGATAYNANGGPQFPRLVLSGDNGDHPALVFADGNPAVFRGRINMTANSVSMNGGNGNPGTNSVAMGMGQIHNGSAGTVALGHGTTTIAADAIAIGREAFGSRTGAIAIGALNGINLTRAIGENAVAIGRGASASNSGAIAIGAPIGGSVTSSNSTNSIAVGTAASASDNSAIAIGTLTSATASSAISINTGGAIDVAGARAANSIAMGAISSSTSRDSVAIGYNARNSGNTYEKSVAIGSSARTNSQQSIAIGNGANTNAYRSIAIGDGATVPNNAHSNSMAIGPGATTSGSGQIVLGTTDHTVHIPGNLLVDGHVLLAGTRGHNVYLREETFNSGWNNIIRFRHVSGAVMWGEDGINSVTVGNITRTNSSTSSDRRLKNVGKKYEAGLAELKKLEFYHYTFKADKDKTPQVGVMAQDLQKVFPTAVTKGPDGYLRIRRDEMFYAVINAVKELDARLSELASKVQAYFDRTEKLEAQVKAQDKIIKDLTARIEKLEKLK